MTTPTENLASRHSPFRSEEIVVATPHADRVVDALGRDTRDRPYAGVIETSEGLGLSRVRLVQVDEIAARFAQILQDPRLPGSDRPMGIATPLDKVLAGLRLSFARDWDGWVPTMGKNRIMLGGEAYPITNPRDDGRPSADVSTADLPAASRGGDGVLVGLLDTPVRMDVPFAERLLPESSRLDPTDTATTVQGHGTFSAGLVHQRAGEADLVVRGVLSGRDADATAWEVAVALVDLVAEFRGRVQIVNMSLGCFTDDNEPPLVLETAVSMVRDDVVLLAAAGNHGRGREGEAPSGAAPLWPAALDGVVAVGGRQPRDGGGFAPTDFTPKAPWVNLLADGSGVISTYIDGKVSVDGTVTTFKGAARWSGSSMASATAAGRLAALADGADGVRGALKRVLAGEHDDALTPGPVA